MDANHLSAVVHQGQDSRDGLPLVGHSAPFVLSATGPPQRAVIYIRVSTEEQVTGHSLDAQRASANAFIASRGWSLVGEYVDAGHSAKPGARRPAFERLLADVHRGHFDVIVVDKVDRFYRHLKGLLITLDTLNEAGVSFVSVRENLDLSTPWGKLTLTVLGMLAEIYIDNLREETKKGRLQRARKGLYNGTIPLGYCNGRCSACTDPNGPGYCPFVGEPDRGDGRVPILHPIDSVAVRLAFEWYLTGDFTDGALAERLNGYEHCLPSGAVVGFRTKGRYGRFAPGSFGKDAVRHLLQCPFYAGLVPYYGRDAEGRRRKRNQVTSTFPGQHPAIVSREEFREAQALRRQLSRRPRNPQTGSRHVYPLSGLLICNRCGRRMRGVGGGKGLRYYRDTSRIEHRDACPQPLLRADEIEEQVIDLLRSIARGLPSDWREQVRAMVVPPEQRAALEQREGEALARLERARRLYLDGHITYEQFLDEQHRGQAALADLRPAKIDAIIAVGNVLETFDAHWEQATEPLQKNGLLRLALAGVRVEGYTLTAVQLTLPLYPLVRLACRSGADGSGPTTSDEAILIIHPAAPVQHFLAEYLDDRGRGLAIL